MSQVGALAPQESQAQDGEAEPEEEQSGIELAGLIEGNQALPAQMERRDQHAGNQIPGVG